MIEVAANLTVRWQTLRLVRIERQTARVTSFFLSGSQPIAFRAGQHVTVRLTAESGHTAQRSYSIASAPESPDVIELAIERLDDGEVSPYFHEVAAVGDEVEIRGPVGGHFVWSAAEGGPLLLAAGGSGVVPLMSMIRHRQAQHSQVPTVLLYSARTWDEILYRDELIATARQPSGFDVFFALTRDSTPHAGHFSRRVDAPMMAEVMAQLPELPHFAFVCGSNAFVEAAAQTSIQSGLPASVVRTERFGL